METIICPKCGTENPTNAMNCKHCRINLKFALHPEEIERAKQEAIEAAGSPVVTDADETPKRGGCLTAFLILAMIGNALLALAQWAIAGDLPSGMASLAVIGGVLNVAGLIFAIGVWNWKKWGVYGYVGGIGLSMLLSLAMGEILATMQGIVPIVLLIGLTRPVWKHFK